MKIQVNRRSIGLFTERAADFVLFSSSLFIEGSDHGEGQARNTFFSLVSIPSSMVNLPTLSGILPRSHGHKPLKVLSPHPCIVYNLTFNSRFSTSPSMARYMTQGPDV